MTNGYPAGLGARVNTAAAAGDKKRFTGPSRPMFLLIVLAALILPAAAAQAGNPGAQTKNLISVNFIDVDIRSALSALAMEQEINIACAPEVSGNISVHLNQATLEETLEALTLAAGVEYEKRDEIYFVYKPKEAREPQAERLQIKVFELKYAELDKVQEILDGIPGLRLIKTHEPSKTVIVEDTPENIAKVARIVTFWDSRPRQVMIEAKILEIDLTEDMSMGVNWSAVLGDVRIGTGSFSSAAMPTAQGLSPVPGTGAGVFGNVITGAGTAGEFQAALDALETKTRIETLSTPKILAIHGKPAKVQVGGKQGYKVSVVSEGVVNEDIRWIDTGTILEITPYIDADNNILLNVTPSINSARIEEGIPVVNTTVVTTWLLARDGETALIGGLIQNTRTRRNQAVPCLGDVPGLGFLFGRTVRGTGKSELVVLITPKILEPPDEAAAKALEKIRKLEETMEGQAPGPF